MAWPARKYFDELIRTAERYLHLARIIRLEIGTNRALIDIEGQWGEHRIVLSEIHRPDGSVRYAYYALDRNNRLVIGFDNSSDIQAIKMRFGNEWRQHLHEEVPHKHDSQGNLQLTDEMDANQFVNWLQTNLPSKIEK